MDANLRKARNVTAAYAISSVAITLVFAALAAKFPSASYDDDYQTPAIIFLFLALSVIFTITAVLLTIEIRDKNSRGLSIDSRLN